MILTEKQSKLMFVIMKGDGQGRACTVDEILHGLETHCDWKTTKQSLQFSIRKLREKRLIRKLPVELVRTEGRRGRIKRRIDVTILGFQVYNDNKYVPQVSL